MTPADRSVGSSHAPRDIAAHPARPHPVTHGKLSREITLPWLVFYGVGVTVGAGIFALIGEILGVSGDRAPLAFLAAGIIAAFTGVSYMGLVRQYPRAGGEAVYVTTGLGEQLGRIAGLGVVVTGTISSAVVALAFGGYLSDLISIDATVGALLLVALLVGIACWGVRESVTLAAVVTLVEVGALIVVAFFGLPDLGGDVVEQVVAGDESYIEPIFAGAVVAFFAFIGFEDIANMAEETVDPRRTAPRAIAWTLGISITIYVVLAMIAVAVPDRSAITESNAPMASLFEQVSDRPSELISTVAAFAMTNGILVQLVMASRVLYGMAREDLLPAPLRIAGRVGSRQTPVIATVMVGAAVMLLAALVPLGRLARVTSFVTLIVFTLVNLALYAHGRRRTSEDLHWMRYNGLVGAVLALGLLCWQVGDAVVGF